MIASWSAMAMRVAAAGSDSYNDEPKLLSKKKPRVGISFLDPPNPRPLPPKQSLNYSKP
jgi:hypothetical protein